MGYFVVTIAIFVTVIVILCWPRKKKSPFYTPKEYYKEMQNMAERDRRHWKRRGFATADDDVKVEYWKQKRKEFR